jgi:hypothetical protein
MNCRECVVIGECSETVYMYLVKIGDEIFGVVARGVLVSVLVSERSRVGAKCAKSVVRVRIIVLTAACGRTANGGFGYFRASCDVFGGLLGGLDE